MKILVIATKAPWPPVDGGRFLLLNTLEALAAAGCKLTLVAPVDPAAFDLCRVARELSAWCEPLLVPAAPLSPVAALLQSSGAPLSIARHSLPVINKEVDKRLRAERFDLVHAEQLQALPQAEPAFSRGIPVVLRAQNVESDLWRAAGERRRGLKGMFLRREARRLAVWEGSAVKRTAATLALTSEDAARLRVLAGGGGRVRVGRAPFPELPPGSGRLAGDPPVVVFGSRGWLPNEDSVAWYLKDVWPLIQAELPAAVLHVFGSDLASPPPGVVAHPSPGDSGEAFPPGSILTVPLRIASGVRIKILEAWARGVPVVGTPAALAGLEVKDGREALVAREPGEFAVAIRRLREEPALAAAIIAEGHRARRERHDPPEIARRLIAEYEKVT
jgi:polysaccharide biosynthesis protein PslH